MACRMTKRTNLVLDEVLVAVEKGIQLLQDRSCLVVHVLARLLLLLDTIYSDQHVCITIFASSAAVTSHYTPT